MSDNEAHAAFLRSRPSREGLRALVEHLEPGAMVAGVRRLKGGLEASTHRVDLVTRTGARRPIVVRRFNSTFRWYDPSRLPREAVTLGSLEHTEVPAPRVLEVDVEGRWFGTPSMIITCLPGGPAPWTRWVDWSRSLVEAMKVMHAVEPVVDAEPFFTGWARDEPPESRAADPWLERVWPVIQSHRDELAASEGDALVHHDLHPGNAVWFRGRVSGIVDWPMAGRGYPAYDRAYLRLDVSMCLGLEAGDAISELQDATDSPAWDLVVGLRADPDSWVSGYNELGAPVTVSQLRARLAGWYERAMAQLA